MASMAQGPRHPRVRVELGERDRGARREGTSDLLPTDGHAEAGEEPASYRRQRERWITSSSRRAEATGELRGQASREHRGNDAPRTRRGGTVLRHHARSRRQRVLRPVSRILREGLYPPREMSGRAPRDLPRGHGCVLRQRGAAGECGPEWETAGGRRRFQRGGGTRGRPGG